ncbi:hypothetical protein PVAP13_3NG316464 [Panicum virgatum]|uniref:Uncharacterized protein n=1 Tax=Panicum virgatum TaxID=38727 RepID=A0A8T0ULA9_PANVG|nr:hypothetical protein PVAP13_3NG316464 [Panicum virgatum]
MPLLSLGFSLAQSRRQPRPVCSSAALPRACSPSPRSRPRPRLPGDAGAAHPQLAGGPGSSASGGAVKQSKLPDRPTAQTQIWPSGSGEGRGPVSCPGSPARWLPSASASSGRRQWANGSSGRPAAAGRPQAASSRRYRG